MVFSSGTRKILLESRWHEGRTVTDVSLWLSALRARGFQTFAIVEAFLKQFGGLNITVTLQSKTYRRLLFNPFGYAYSDYPETVKAFSEVLGVTLCPIGVEDDQPLLMDEDGKVYLDMEGELFLFADTGEEAIERICQFTQSQSSILVAEVETPNV